MRKYEAIEKLEGFVSTIQVLDEGKDYGDDIKEAKQLLSDVCKECKSYIKNLMGDKNYAMVLNLPFRRLEVASKSNAYLDLVYFPFGMFSISLWGRLKMDDKNPVFRVIRYFELNAKYLGIVLGDIIDNNQLMTAKTMRENQIIDLFSMHSYYYLYEYASDYLRCNTNIRGIASSWAVRLGQGGVPVVVFKDERAYKPERVIEPLDVHISNSGLVITQRTFMGTKVEYICPFSRLSHESSRRTVRQISDSLGFKPLEQNVLYFVYDLLAGLLGDKPLTVGTYKEFDLNGLLDEYSGIKNELNDLDLNKIIKNIMG